MSMAEDARNEIKRMASPVENAYEAPPPPPGQTVKLLLGVIFGAIIGAAAAAAVAFVGVFVIFLALAWASTGYGVVFMHLIIFAVSVIFLPGTFIVAGLLSSSVVPSLSGVPRECKGVAGWCFFSAVSASLLAKPAHVAAASIISSPEISEFWIARAISSLLGLGVAGWIYAAAGVFVSVLAASKYAKSDKRYCGNCRRYFRRKDFGSVSVQRAKKVAEALDRQDFSSISSLLSSEDESACVSPVMYRCPGCGIGYFDLKVDIKYKHDVGTENTEPVDITLDSWLMCSAILPPDIGEQLADKNKRNA